MWICVGPRDPAIKPSRGCLRVVELSAIPQLPPLKVPGEEVITKKRFVSWAVYTNRKKWGRQLEFKWRLVSSLFSESF